MSRHLRAGLAALILMAAVAGCSSTTTTTAPTSTASSSTKSTSPTTTTSETSTTSTSTSVVPAPPNSLTMTCKDWRDLDDPTQLAVVKEIVTQPDFKGAVTDPDGARLVAKGACLLFSTKTVNDVLRTGS
jgi:ABC-type enterochelin transport system substrate-binding protein